MKLSDYVVKLLFGGYSKATVCTYLLGDCVDVRVEAAHLLAHAAIHLAEDQRSVKSIFGISSSDFAAT